MEVKGKGGISAKIIADSISSVNGKRLTTFELNYPRFIHSEFMTHRMLSRNAASSRAIPVNKVIEQVENKPAMPIHWGKNEKGMQAKEECKNLIGECSREQLWRNAAWCATDIADAFSEAGYHKQIVNRILEPYQFIKVVCSATEFDNFFWLRCHEDAQPEIKELADCMYKAYSQCIPERLQPGEWHTPYVSHKNDVDGNCSYYIDFNGETITLSLEEALKVSSSCCAQVSFRALDNSLEKACEIYDMLVESKPVHSSPFEHQSTPMEIPETMNLTGSSMNKIFSQGGVTHVDRDGDVWSGNFQGFIQHRQLIPENTCWNYS